MDGVKMPKGGSSSSGTAVHNVKFFEPDLKTYTVIRIITVIIAAGLIIAMAQFSTKPLKRFLDCNSDSHSCQSSKRIQTIMSITVSFLIAIVAIVGVGFVLNILGVKLGSILAGAGIVGLIIGLGAQSVIKDIVTGILIISENQISEGDYVYITSARGEEIQGTVTDLSVRLVKLQNDQGSEVFIPSGNIMHIANTSRNDQTVTVTVSTPISTDVRSITNVLQSLAAQLSRDPSIEGMILMQPEVQGVETLSDSTYTTQIQTKVAAGNQWTIGNYIRLQVVQALQNLEVHAPKVFVNIERMPGSSSPSVLPNTLVTHAKMKEGSGTSGMTGASGSEEKVVPPSQEKKVVLGGGVVGGETAGGGVGEMEGEVSPLHYGRHQTRHQGWSLHSMTHPGIRHIRQMVNV